MGRRSAVRSISGALALSVGLLAGSLPSLAHAAGMPAPSVGPVSTVAAGGWDRRPQLEISQDGRLATMAWTRELPSGDATEVWTRSATVQDGTFTWGEATRLGAGSAPATADVFLAMSRDGTRVTAAWSAVVGGWAGLNTASAVVDGGTAEWGPTTAFEPGDQLVADEPVAVSADGRRGVMTYRSVGAASVESARAFTVDGTTQSWGVPVAVTDGWIDVVDLSADGGTALFGWRKSHGNSSSDWQAAATVAKVSGTDVAVGPARALSPVPTPGHVHHSPHFALSGDGRTAIASWTHWDQTSRDCMEVLHTVAAVSSDAPDWAAPSAVDARCEWGLENVGLSLSADGTQATATYLTDAWAQSREALQSRTARVTGGVAAWGPASVIVAGGTQDVTPHQFRASPNGRRGVVTWRKQDIGESGYGDTAVQVSFGALSPTGQAWSAPVSLPTAGPDAQDADLQLHLSDDARLGAVSWSRPDHNTRISSIGVVAAYYRQTSPPPPVTSLAQACPAGQVPDAGYTDVGGSFAVHEINCVSAYGVARGTSASTYSPDALVTRGQMATFLFRVGTLAGQEWDTRPGTQYRDVTGSGIPEEFQSAIWALTNAGVVGGFGDGTFRPLETVTRAQMSKFLALTIAAIAGPTSTTEDYFIDDDGTALEPYANQVASLGILVGDGLSLADPSGRTPRSHMAAFVSRTLAVLVEHGEIAPPFS